MCVNVVNDCSEYTRFLRWIFFGIGVLLLLGVKGMYPTLTLLPPSSRFKTEE